MGEWSFLTNHAQALVLIAKRPDSRLRDIAEMLDVTERTAFAIVGDLAGAGYLEKQRLGRRNLYHVHTHLPVRESIGRRRAVGELLEVFLD